jgi:hypothetical protein
MRAFIMQAKIFYTRGTFLKQFQNASQDVAFKFAKHAPHPMRVSLLKEMAVAFAEGYEATSRAKFR